MSYIDWAVIVVLMLGVVGAFIIVFKWLDDIETELDSRSHIKRTPLYKLKKKEKTGCP
jgi:hypothetical protein